MYHNVVMILLTVVYFSDVVSCVGPRTNSRWFKDSIGHQYSVAKKPKKNVRDVK